MWIFEWVKGQEPKDTLFLGIDRFTPGERPDGTKVSRFIAQSKSQAEKLVRHGYMPLNDPHSVDKERRVLRETVDRVFTKLSGGHKMGWVNSVHKRFYGKSPNTMKMEEKIDQILDAALRDTELRVELREAVKLVEEENADAADGSGTGGAESTEARA